METAEKSLQKETLNEPHVSSRENKTNPTTMCYDNLRSVTHKVPDTFTMNNSD